MNVFEMEKEFNDLMKHGQELIEKLKNTQDITLRNKMKEYIIIFNGSREKWVVSDNMMTFDEAQEWIAKQDGVSPSVVDFWEKDTDTKKPRWLLLKDEGAKEWVWCETDPEEIGKDNACYAYNTDLSDGGVAYDLRANGISYTLCRVDF